LFPPCQYSLLSATTCIQGKQFKVRQVCGKVRDWQGVEIPNASVQLKRQGQGQAFAEVQTASDGSFAIADVPSGDYEIRVALKGFWNASQDFQVDHPRKSAACSRPIRVVMKVAGQCGYVENAWKKKNLH
jgi:Carboxypeptidase regulatory-like domain